MYLMATPWKLNWKNKHEKLFMHCKSETPGRTNEEGRGR